MRICCPNCQKFHTSKKHVYENPYRERLFFCSNKCKIKYIFKIQKGEVKKPQQRLFPGVKE